MPLLLDIRRTHVLIDAMCEAKKKKFTVTKKVQVSPSCLRMQNNNKSLLHEVTFVGEGAVDYGGPRREFFRMLASDAAKSFFVGNDFMKFFFKMLFRLVCKYSGTTLIWKPLEQKKQACY